MGKFYIVEGPDAGGKTTTAIALAGSIGAVPITYKEGFWDMPKGSDARAFFTDRIIEQSEMIKEALEKGDVVTARSKYSIPAITYAHQGARIDPVEDVVDADIIVYVTADWDTLRERLVRRVENGEKKKLSGHERCEEKYARLLQRYEELFEGDPRVIKIDTSKTTVDETVERIMEFAKR